MKLVALAIAGTVAVGAAGPLHHPDQESSPLEVGYATVELPGEIDEPVVIEQDGSDLLAMSLPVGSDASVESVGDSIAYVDDAASLMIDISVPDLSGEPVLDSGVQAIKTLYGAEAEEIFSYPVEVPQGFTLSLMEDGSVELLNAEGDIEGIFAAPWAVDAEGNPVETYFDVVGDGLVQYVLHRAEGVSYPVIADPLFLVPVAVKIGAKLVTVHVVRSAATRAAAQQAAQAMTLRVAAPHVVTNALKSFQTLRFQTGNRIFSLDKPGMEHILVRHHPSYWNGSLPSGSATPQSFFARSASIADIRSLVHSALRLSTTRLQQVGTGFGSWDVRIDGILYRIAVSNGRVTQFYPKV